MLKPYDEKELEHFRERLLERKRQLWYDVAESMRDDLKGEYQEQLSTARDDPEKALVDLMGDTDMILLEGRQGELQAIEEALQRIDEGTYGLCTECGERIPPRRLEVMPFAVRCVEDQARQEGRLERASL